MSAQPPTYTVDDPETALKYAIQHYEEGRRPQIVEGVIELTRPQRAHDTAADRIRDQIAPVVAELGCLAGSGDLDLPGSSNWYVPDLAVAPRALAKGATVLLPEQTLLIVEITSDPDGDAVRVAKRRRYAEYGAPFYLLVDRQEKSCTLFSEPGELGYATSDGPHTFGILVHLPAPFNLDLDTSEL
ncbi:Uma2 family endonuclease [Streptomyces syringium]|uniref:Uma2 family endonuclease n=1 Tax=Streptomyces syringium TaxID=76729 RepID=UPI003D8ACFBE